MTQRSHFDAAWTSTWSKWQDSVAYRLIADFFRDVGLKDIFSEPTPHNFSFQCFKAILHKYFFYFSFFKPSSKPHSPRIPIPHQPPSPFCVSSMGEQEWVEWVFGKRRLLDVFRIGSSLRVGGVAAKINITSQQLKLYADVYTHIKPPKKKHFYCERIAEKFSVLFRIKKKGWRWEKRFCRPLLCTSVRAGGAGSMRRGKCSWSSAFERNIFS